MIRCTCVCIY